MAPETLPLIAHQVSGPIDRRLFFPTADAKRLNLRDGPLAERLINPRIAASMVSNASVGHDCVERRFETSLLKRAGVSTRSQQSHVHLVILFWWLRFGSCSCSSRPPPSFVQGWVSDMILPSKSAASKTSTISLRSYGGCVAAICRSHALGGQFTSYQYSLDVRGPALGGREVSLRK